MPKCHSQFRCSHVPHQGLLPNGVLGIGIIHVGIFFVVGGVRRRKDDARHAGIRGNCVALVIARSGVVVLSMGRGGRRSVIAPIVVPPCVVALLPWPNVHLPCCLCPPPSCLTLLPGDPLQLR
jgi:hypothetical protein